MGESNRYGFSIVEMVVTVGILGVVAVIVITAFTAWRGKSALDSARRDIESVLKLARSKTLASEGYKKYGVQFIDDSNSYRLCENPTQVFYLGYTYTCSPVLMDYKLPPNITFCASTGLATELQVENYTGTVWPAVRFSLLKGEYENISPGISPAQGIVFVYDKSKITSPCGNAVSIYSCIANKTCAGVLITKGGVIYGL